MSKAGILCIRCKCQILKPSAPILSTRRGEWSYCGVCRRSPQAVESDIDRPWREARL